jgi:lipopolysaccharide cholinephosphotransferase
LTNDYGNLELHKVLLSAMKDIDKICRENGLRYYLHAGTLLGAFNHGGFIPWDDDVDISLMREDYEQLCRILQKEYADRYFLHNYHTDPHYPNNRSVLRVLGTKVTHYHEDKESLHPEVAVDLVPLDAAPDSKILRKLQAGAIWILDAAVQIKQGSIVPHHPVMKCIGLLSKIDRQKLGVMIDRLSMMCNDENTEDVGLLTYTARNPYMNRSGYENEIWPRKWYEAPQWVSFEDTKLMTISDPEAYFLWQYGPHWAEPYPEEKRVTKHDVKSYEISPEVRERIGL